MTRLEKEVDRLRDLDRSRERATKLRDREWDALLKNEREWPVKSQPDGSPPLEPNLLATAEVLKALLTRRALVMSKAEDVCALNRLTKTLGNVPPDEALSSKPDGVPVLRAAKAMCALAAAPDSAFSASVMYFLYTIVREIYLATPPGWSVGGARAGEGAAPNGFVTWQCVRAIIDFQQAMKQTAELLEAVAAVLKQSDEYRAIYRELAGSPPQQGFPGSPPASPLYGSRYEWAEVDASRLDLSFLTTLDSLRDNIAVKLPALRKLFAAPGSNSDDQGGPAAEEMPSRHERVRDFILQFRQQLKDAIAECRDGFARAMEDLEADPAIEQGSEQPKEKIDARRRLASTGHLVAFQTVYDAFEHAERAYREFTDTDENPSEKELEEIAKCFSKAAVEFDALLKPVTAHVTRVVDGELGIASSGSPYAWTPRSWRSPRRPTPRRPGVGTTNGYAGRWTFCSRS